MLFKGVSVNILLTGKVEDYIIKYNFSRVRAQISHVAHCSFKPLICLELWASRRPKTASVEPLKRSVASDNLTALESSPILKRLKPLFRKSTSMASIACYDSDDDEQHTPNKAIRRSGSSDLLTTPQVEGGRKNVDIAHHSPEAACDSDVEVKDSGRSDGEEKLNF